MADITETTTAGFYPGGIERIYSPRAPSGSRILPTAGMRVSRFAFTNVNDGDTWTSGLTSILAVAVTALSTNTDTCSAQFTDAGVVTFSCSAANGEYGLTVWSR